MREKYYSLVANILIVKYVLRNVNMICIFKMKRDCLLYSVNVKLFFEFFVMREKANYFCVKVFSEEV